MISVGEPVLPFTIGETSSKQRTPPTDSPAVSELSTYAYSYPHKSAYRGIEPAIPLVDVWREEDASNLSLYIHLPFCEMRCGFCNLFAASQPTDDRVDTYLDALGRQARAVRAAVVEPRITDTSLGGGTPTWLTPTQLTRLFDLLNREFPPGKSHEGVSVETSPATATTDRLTVLRDHSVHRISIGVQSFIETETQALGRPQDVHSVHRALEAIRDQRFPLLNIDLIYGQSGQTAASWIQSLTSALQYDPEELYLYPLYVRRQTGLGQRGEIASRRRDLYRLGRDLLLDAGYRQTSLRCFTKVPGRREFQVRQMIGLGCGARSYTSRLHYGTRYAVRQQGVRAILRDWVRQSTADFAVATHGYLLDLDERMRRRTILSLMDAEGVDLANLEDEFGVSLARFDSQWQTLEERGWIEACDDRRRIRLTANGLENSDVIAPLFYSRMVLDRFLAFLEDGV